jgi:hypothetical protein
MRAGRDRVIRLFELVAKIGELLFKFDDFFFQR